MTSNPGPILGWAEAYAGRGYAVQPVHPPHPEGGCTCPSGFACKSPGKHPFGPHGYQDATVELPEIQNRFGSTPNANIGINCERSGVVCLDFDFRHGAAESLQQLISRYPDLVDTVVEQTGNGYHAFYRRRSTSPVRKALAEGVDVISSGGVVVTPSLHKTGVRYAWLPGRSPFDRQPAYLPQEIEDLLRRTPPPRVRGRPMRTIGMQAADAEAIRARCGWFNHCIDAAAELPEPEWYRFLSVIARTRDADRHAHEWSGAHPSYDPRETDRKLRQAAEKAGPVTCAYVQNNFDVSYCNSCKYRGKVHSPVTLGGK